MRRKGRVAKMGSSLAREIVFESLGPWSFQPSLGGEEPAREADG